MPIYKVEAPDGKIYRLEGPEGSTPEQLSDALYSQVPEASTPFVKESGLFAGVKKGIEQLTSQGRTVAGTVTGDANEAAKAALARNKAMQDKYAEQVSMEKVKEAYNKDGILSAAGEVASQVPLAIAEQLPNFAASFAGAKAGAALGRKAGAGFGARGQLLGGIGGGLAGAFTPSYTQAFGGNIERQAQEQEQAKQPINIDTSKAALTAAPQAVLDVASDRILLGGKMFGKMIGVPENLLFQGGAEGVEKLAKERFLTTIAKGTATGVAGEIPTEVTQQMLERYQAGLPLASKEAFKEYGDTAYAVGLLGPLGAAGRFGDKSGAKEQIQQKVMEQRREADAAAAAAAPKPPDITDPAYLQQIQTQYQEAEQRKAALKSQLRKVQDGSVTETADRLHNKDIEEQIKAMTPELEQLAAEYNKAAKVAPAFTPEAAPGPVETPEAVKVPEAVKPTTTVGDALDNPLGRFTKAELPPEVVAYIDIQRKNLGKPALDDYSIEDIRDALPDSGIPGTQGTDQASKTQTQSLAKVDLNSLIAGKTGYTPDVTYKPEDIINVAKQKNIATDTDGFKFFLQRATGENNLTKMEQPQLHSAFTALSGLPEFDETQFLPEKTSATHYSQKQYNDAVQKVNGLASEKDIPSSQALQVAKKATGLTRDSDVQLLLQNAYTSGDLNLSSKGDFITAQPAEQAEFRVEEGFTQAQPTGFNVMRGDQLLYSTQNEAEANAKVESLSKTADPAMKQIDKSIASERSTVAASQRSLDIMEAAGMFRTPKYQQASAQHAALSKKAYENIQRLNEKKTYLQQPVTIQTTGKPLNVKTYKVKEKGVSEKAFNTREEALKHALENLPAARLNELAGKTKAPGFAKRLQAEIERRKAPPKQFVAEKPEPKVEPKVKAKVEPKPETTAQKEAVKSQILPMLKKFGLGDVALQIEEGMQAEGSYAASVIKVALDANNPVRVLRHESLHGLKDLGFFTPGQWKVLENQADKVWIDKYLKQRNINGQPIQGGQQSRFEAYQNLYDGDMDAIREEAIADAFGDFDVNGAPKGLFATLLQKMQDFFRALRSAFTGAGYETADDVFGKVERGELKATAKVAEQPSKESVRELSTKDRKEVESPEDLQEKSRNRMLLESHAKSLAEYNKLTPQLQKKLDAYRFAERRAESTMTKSGNQMDRSQSQSAITRAWNAFNTAFKDTYGRGMTDEENFAHRSDFQRSIDEYLGKEVPTTKFSLAGEGVPLSTKGIMESNTKYAQANLGLNGKIVYKVFNPKTGEVISAHDARATAEKKAKKLGLEVRDEQVNNVRDIAKTLNKQTIAEQGAMGEKDLSPENSKIIANAIADEVGYQLSVTAKTGTGLGWYSNNYPKAVKLLSSRFPELQDSKHARSVFSALVAVTSNGERVDKNIANAIELYADLRQGKPLVAMGNRRATALENNLKQIEDLLAKHKENFEQELTREITVKDLNAYLRSVGEKTSGDYLANTKVPAAAIYFGPKLGAFFANLSGSEGYLTMDLWWTRSINRMRGLLIPKATEASITKFRDMMDRPSATREEVIAASIPLRNKYEEYGYTTELEHLVGSKEPSTSANKPAWFKKAEKAGGDAYEQLKYEHNLEKMANTIYKNEYDMLEEAPFTASDRKFMYDAARQAQRILGERGVKLTLADIQAALWYYEKRLYAKLSGREADDIGYEEAIIGQSRKSDRRERPSVVFSGQPDGGNVAAGEVAVPNEDGGRANEEKLSLRTAPDTLEFKRWFGDSNVVDDNGDPLVVYHSTFGDFNSFEKTKDIGYHFGSSFVANKRAEVAAKDKGRGSEKLTGMNLMPVYLSIKNPAVLSKDPGFWEPSTVLKSLYKSVNLPYREFDALAYKVTENANSEERKVKEERGLSRLPKLEREEILSRNFKPFYDELRSELESQGFDGMVYLNEYEGQGETKAEMRRNPENKTYVAFQPEQIKSATGNIGTYDPKNPDIRKSLRTAPDTPEFKRWFGDSKIVTSKYTGPVSGTNVMDWLRIPEDEQINYWGNLTPQARTSLMKDYRNRDGVGNPKIMYHGTARDITTFKPKQAGAIFLTDDIDFAEGFASMSADWMAKNVDQFLTPQQKKDAVQLAIKNVKADYGKTKASVSIIKDLQSGNPTGEAMDKLVEAYREMMPSGPNVMPVYVRAEKPFDYENPDHIRQIEAKSTYGLPVNEISMGRWQTIESKRIQELIKEAGFDSFYVEENGRKNLAVYDSSQIKSAIGNIGTYDINNPDIRYSLRTDVAEDIRNMPNGAAIEAAINRTTTARQELGYAERMTEALANRSESFSYFRQKFFDRYNRLNDVERQIAQQMGGVARLADQSAHAAALQSDAAAGVAASALGVGNRMGGMPVYRNGYTTVSNENGTVKGAVEIFSPLAKYGDPKIYQAYQFWAGAKRGKRLMASGKEELYTQQDMALAKQLEEKYPEFVSVQKEWIKYNNGLVKYAVDTGVVSAQNADEFTRYSDYVPFYRQLEGERTVGPNIFQSISGVKGPQKITGSEAPLADFLETVVRNTQSIIQAGMKNVAAQKAVDGGVMIGMVRKLDHVSSAPDVVTILKNGQKVSYECADKLWVDAVSSLNLPELPFLNFIAAPANFLRTMVTKDPGFMLANLMRDSISAYVTSGAKLTPVASAVKEMTNVLMNNSPEYQKLLSAGVLGGYEFSRNIEASTEAFGKDLRKKTGTKTGFESATSPFTFFWDALEKGTEASDAATRIAVYKATLAETGNEAEAIHRALEVMNFNRKGSSIIVRVAAATIPFLNARVQGLDVFFRSGIRPFLDGNATEQEKQVQKAMIIRGMTILSLSVMYAAAISGNPDYEKQEEETKDNNWIIPMGEGKTPLKIPIPFEVGTLFKTVPERIYRSFFMADKENRDTTEALHKSMKRALQSTFGFNPVPQIAAPLLEARDNYSVFTQRPIVGQNMQGIAPEFQVGPGTSKWAEILGQQAGMSPMMIDHVFKGYTGTMGVYAADLLDAGIGAVSPSEVEKPSKRIDQMPIIKRFLADPEARGKITSYFDLKHQVDTTVRTINMLEKQADPNLPDYVEKNAQLFAARDFMNNLNKQMDDLQRQANMIRSAPIPADEKQEMLREITKAQNLLVNDIRQIRNILKP